MLPWAVVWLFGVLCGGAFSGFILAAWVSQEPGRLGTIMRWMLDALDKRNGGAFIKIYVALFDTRRDFSKVVAYARPEDVAEAIRRYARQAEPIPLQTHPGMANVDSESKENPRTRS